MEFSKKLTIFLLVLSFGIIAMYFVCVWFEKPISDMVAVSAISELIASQMLYLGYQGYCKNSRNKHRIDKDGRPFNEQSFEEQVV